jgi:hypothetical protein
MIGDTHKAVKAESHMAWGESFLIGDVGRAFREEHRMRLIERRIS